MKRRRVFRYICCLGLILALGSLGGAAGPPGTLDISTPEKIKRKTDPSRKATHGPKPLANLKEAKLLLAKYEKRLPRAKASRGQTLAELARLCFIVGEFGAEKGRKKYFEQGRGYAELLRREQPRRVEGHYWLALNLAGLAEMSGAKRDLRLVPILVKELRVAAKLNQAYDQAGPLRVLGRIYYQAPAWPLSVGDLHKSVELLSIAVKLAPENSTNHLYLAETLIDLKHFNQACQELEKAVKATAHANWAPGLQDDHRKAQDLLKQCKTGPNSHPI